MGIHNRDMRSFLLVMGLLFTSHVFASFPDLTGNYEGQRTLTYDTGLCVGGTPASPTNTRNTKTTFSNFDPVAGTFNVLREVDTNGTFYPRSGSGRYVTASVIEYTASGPSALGGTVSIQVTETVGLDSTSSYVTSLSTSATGTADNSAVGSWTCPFTTTGSSVRVSGPPTTGSIINPEVAPSNTVTSNVATLTQVVTTTTNTLNARIQSALHGAFNFGPRRVANGVMYEVPTGLSAGDTFQNIGLWGSYSYSDFENDFVRTKYDGKRHMFFGGVDFTPRDNMVLGVAFGYEDTDIDTDFNNGGLDADGWTIAPYFGYILNDTWNIDLSAGWSDVDTDQNRNFGAINSDVDTTRWFISANINGFTQIDNWLLTGRAGLLNAQSEDDDFTESGVGGQTWDDRTTNLTQFNIGGEVAYSMGDFEPFISAYYNNDLHASDTVLTAGAQPSNDNDDVLVGIGFRYFKGDNLSISAQLDTRQGRDDFDENTFTINARWDF